MNIQPFCSFNGQLTKENVMNAHQKWEALPQSHSYSMGIEIHPSKPDLSKRRLEKLPISSGEISVNDDYMKAAICHQVPPGHKRDH